MTAALIVAAGTAERFSGGRGKAFARLGRASLLARCLETFGRARSIDRIVVAVSPGDLGRTAALIRRLGLAARCRAVAGGACRAASVGRALEALEPGVRTVLVHDVARPLVSAALVEGVARAARRGAVVPAVPLADTLKEAKSGLVVSTLPRGGLFRVQTPQGFPAGLLRRAFRASARRLDSFTDDASMVESLGEPVRILAGEETNIKITVPGDLILARALLAARGVPGATGRSPDHGSRACRTSSK